MVELNQGFTDEDQSAKPGGPAEGEERAGGEGEDAAPAIKAAEPAYQPPPPPPQPTESQDAGVQRVSAILGAATQARWPMYLRNVKQILRNANGGFDERRYGFGGLMDLLKACQRAGLVRIERDRRGGLRVFQGSALQVPTVHPTYGVLPRDVEESTDAPPADVPAFAPPTAPADVVDAGPSEIQSIPVDTTAELLGRAKPKPRARAAKPAPAARAARSAAKPAARRTARARKPPSSDEIV
jgi:hypothetical protein